MEKDRKTRSLRQKIADWPPLTEAVATILAGYLRLLQHTCRWQEDGRAEMEAAIAEHGSVILVFWHQTVYLATFGFDPSTVEARSLNADSRAGRLAEAIIRRHGHKTMAMPRGRAGLGAVRQVIKGLKSGVSIGIAVDGPSGPARKSKPIPVQWARSSGKPVFIYGARAKRAWYWPTWDRMAMPLPFTSVALVWRRWPEAVPDKLDAAETAALVDKLNLALDAAMADAEAALVTGP